MVPKLLNLYGDPFERVSEIHNKKFDEIGCKVIPIGNAPAVHNRNYFTEEAAKKIYAKTLNRSWMTSRKIGADGFLQLAILVAGTKIKGKKMEKIKKNEKKNEKKMKKKWKKMKKKEKNEKKMKNKWKKWKINKKNENKKWKKNDKQW